MRGPRRKGTAGAALNEMSSEESGSSSSDYEPEVDTNDQVNNDLNHVSLNAPNNMENANPVSNLMHPDLPSTMASNSSESEVRNVATPSLPVCPQPGPSEDNESERDLSQEEVDKLVQLQDLTGKNIFWISLTSIFSFVPVPHSKCVLIVF